MPRKARNRKKQHAKKGARKDETFHPAFETLIKLKKNRPDSKISVHDKQETPEHKKEPDETGLFLEAMRDVKPLNDQGKMIARIPRSDIKPAHPAPDDELEAMAHLSDLVAGNAEMDITFSDEFIEGCVPGFDQRLMKKLRKGQFPIQEYVDLHGLTRQQARLRVRDFIQKSYSQGLRCVLIVHGRGLNSEDNIPVLKERLPVWLRRGPVKKMVLAFSTARPYDGGTGAIYILLRKSRKRRYLER